MLFYAPYYNKLGQRIDDGTTPAFFFLYDQDLTVKEQLQRVKDVLIERGETPIEGLLEYLLKCILYINSGDPDLRHLKVMPPHKTRDTKWYAKRELDFAASPTALV